MEPQPDLDVGAELRWGRLTDEQGVGGDDRHLGASSGLEYGVNGRLDRAAGADHVIDDERRHNAFGLMMSLNMLIKFGDAFDFPGADFDRWCRQVGFRQTEVIHLAGPASAAIAYK